MTNTKRTTKIAVIAIHDGHPAINVKYYANLDAGDVPEATAQFAYDATVEQFWRDAGAIAVELGYSGVFSEGRSGGWLVPYYQYRAGKLYQGEWDGQGPEKGYPTYPDVSARAERARFLKLQKRVAALMADVPAMFREMLEASHD